MRVFKGSYQHWRCGDGSTLTGVFDRTGNDAFKAGKLEAAIELYDRAVEVLERGDALGGGGGVSNEERKIIQCKLARDILQVILHMFANVHVYAHP